MKRLPVQVFPLVFLFGFGTAPFVAAQEESAAVSTVALIPPIR